MKKRIVSCLVVIGMLVGCLYVASIQESEPVIVIAEEEVNNEGGRRLSEILPCGGVEAVFRDAVYGSLYE